MKKRYQQWKAFRKRNKRYFRWAKLVLLGLFLIWYINCLPEKPFNDSTSTVLYDRNMNLLGAKIADDGQWRFPEMQQVPEKFKVCIIEFEDRNFETHIGISLKGILRAFKQNFQKGKIVSGGSTITMQLARIMRKNTERSYFEKLVEMFIATRFEIRYSKDEILAMYASHAPFGNNVVGLETASWRYFGRKASELSWAESATLAVLPNAPGLIYPGKNQEALLGKRNRLLKRLYQAGKLDESSYQLAISEPLPGKPLALPQLAPHLLMKYHASKLKGQAIRSTLDLNLQEKVIAQLQIHHNQLRENSIYNGAVIVTSVDRGEVLAYVGNTDMEGEENGCAVDCAAAPRSTGSILKPFLYEKSLEDGIITPEMLLTDIPSHFGSFSPKNFSGNYNGALPAKNVLSRSLNIPMVHLLNSYGVSKFYDQLKDMGLTTLKQAPRHYGLSLILGGAEARLVDLSNAYTQMAQRLKSDTVSGVRMNYREKHRGSQTKYRSDKACIFETFEAMTEVNRPDEADNWHYFSSSEKIAWKTGTSFGFRDAWSIGLTPEYVVSVWVGNADGEGRPGLTGVNAAAPLMFDVFEQLPNAREWFEKPYADMSKVAVCHESGHRAGRYCPRSDQKWLPKTTLKSRACPYHQLLHLNKFSGQRVDSDCESVDNMKHEAWFVLPPVIEKYYKNTHPNYKAIPEYKADCLSKLVENSLAVIYPKPGANIYIPLEMDGKRGETIFEATHRNSEIRVFWHLDDDYIGETKEIHHLALSPSPGKHRLYLVDEKGISTTINFETITRKK